MQKRIKMQLRRGCALVSALALMVSGNAMSTVSNAKKAVTFGEKAITLSTEEVTLKAGKTEDISVKNSNTKKFKIVKVKWSSNAKKVASAAQNKKNAKKAKIKALKKGEAEVTAKVTITALKGKYKGKKCTLSLKAGVKVTKSSVTQTKAPETTDTPVATDNQTATEAPQVTEAPVVTDAPQATADTPAATDNQTATEAPQATEAPETTNAPAKVTPTPYPYITMQPIPTEVPLELDGVAAEKSSWNDGTLASLSALYAGKKVKFTLKVRVAGNDSPSGNVYIKSNYNGYPTLATVPLTTDWTDVSFEYRFNTFTNSSPLLYFDDEDSGAVTSAMTIYYKNYTAVVVDEGDDLGGTSLAKSSWHKGVLGSFTKATHENKNVTISFKLRESGVENPSGTCDVQSNYPGTSYPTLKSGVPLTTDWTEVSITCDIGTIGNEYPSIYLTGSDITDDMEMYMKDFTITVNGNYTPVTPSEPVTPAAEEHSVYLAGETGYDSEKDGVYVSTSGATSWGTAFAKYGANYGLTDKTFSKVAVELAFYKDGTALTSMSNYDHMISITVASDSSDWSNTKKEKQEYNAGIGTTTLTSDDGMVANTIVLQWKAAEADITEYDAILIKSITLTEAVTSSSGVEDQTISTFTAGNNATVSGSEVSISGWDSSIQMSVTLPSGTDLKDYSGIEFQVKPEGDSEDTYGVLNGKNFYLQVEDNTTGYLSAYYDSAGTGANVLIASATPSIAKGTSTYTTVSMTFDWTNESNIKTAILADGATVTFNLTLNGANQYGYSITNIKLKA